MTDVNFSIKNGLVVNGAFTANSTVVNAAAINATSFFIGNSSVNTSITAGVITLSGVDVSTAITGNAASAYSNAVANAAALYQTTAGLSANVATLTANAAGFLGNSSGTLANVSSWATGNAATAYSNATTFASNASNITTGTLPYAQLGAAVVNTSGNFTIAGNLNLTGTNNYLTAAYFGANVVVNTTAHFVGNATVNTNITAGQISLSGATVNSTIYQGTANNANNLGGAAASAYVNTSGNFTVAGNLNLTGTNNYFGTGFFVGTINATSNGIKANTSGITFGNSTVNVTVNATSFSGIANNANNLGGVAAASYVNTSGAFTITGMLTYTNGITFSNTVTANGSNGTAGYVLTSSGATGNVYWAAAAAGVNTAAQYTWTNSHVFSNSATFNGNLIVGTTSGLSANGSYGTSGQVLTSNGTTVYWAAASAGATLNANNTDTQTFYVGLANTSSGSWTNAVVATSKLYFVPSTGTLSATIFTSLSDQAAKTDIKIIDNAVNILQGVEGVSFKWKDTGKTSFGVIAQQVEGVIPDIVEQNGETKTVNYSAIIGFLIQAVKELSDRLGKLENGG